MKFTHHSERDISLIFLGVLLFYTSCKSTGVSQQRAAGAEYEIVDQNVEQRRDSLLLQKYSSKLETSVQEIEQSLSLYKFIDQQIDTPCSENSEENTINDMSMARELYNEVYNRKILGSYTELKSSNIITRFSSQQYLAQGDMLFFEEKPSKRMDKDILTVSANREPPVHLLGVYLRNKNFITCAKKDGAVAINNLNEDYWQQRYVFAGRLK